jgi:hypothetical protein
MTFTRPVADLVRERFSCRAYAPTLIGHEDRLRLSQAADELSRGPLGTRLRFRMVTAEPGDEGSLRGLGTYGFVKGATGFIVGAAMPGSSASFLEDYGWGMEHLVLLATDLGLGTCWLGGTFSRSAFGRRIDASAAERVPAVVAVGIIGDREKALRGVVRRIAGSSRRKPWGELFFDGRFGVPLSEQDAGPFRLPLSMVMLAPSASNRQPWRIVRAGSAWHLFLRRTPGYGRDIQRVDAGIAMCHFELAARELGLSGAWENVRPEIPAPDRLIEYAVSWRYSP